MFDIENISSQGEAIRQKGQCHECKQFKYLAELINYEKANLQLLICWNCRKRKYPPTPACCEIHEDTVALKKKLKETNNELGRIQEEHRRLQADFEALHAKYKEREEKYANLYNVGKSSFMSREEAIKKWSLESAMKGIDIEEMFDTLNIFREWFDYTIGLLAKKNKQFLKKRIKSVVYEDGDAK